jgi:flavin reductase (DIM6/NTAB) family NADH-FMN oxidoreductase RutF
VKKSLGAKPIVVPAPVWVIGTFDNQCKPNLMTAAWAGVCCSNPPCVAVSIRPSRHTYEGVVQTRAFTVNVPSEDYIQAAVFCGTATGKETDKFKQLGLTPISSDVVNAPYVKEFPLVLECNLMYYFDLGSHTLFVGEIIDVKADEQVLGDNGYPDILKVKPMVYAPGAMSYHGIWREIPTVPN